MRLHPTPLACHYAERNSYQTLMTPNQLPWVVVVDDDADLAQTISEALQIKGWDVTPFSDSTAALSAILHRPPVLIICDIEMPGINGITLATRVLQTLHHCMIVLMSGTQLPQEGSALIAKHAERCRFFAKPVSMRTLRTLLSESGELGHGAQA